MLEEIDFHPSRFSLPDEPTAYLELPEAEATVQLGRLLADTVDESGFVGLIGQLGSGKTTMVGGMVEALGAETPATSP
ncbi:MAG: tRNA (adenosine(37)-N6)-threonylcarbamoyltransferase complex ATPase subunit type 1 TsaE, partial [Bradymonadaceae bacterium]